METIRPTVSLVAVLAVLVAAAPAQAGWKIDRATAIARIVWHNPCVDRMRITWAPLYNTDALAEAYVEDCTIRLDPDHAEEWVPFCTVVLHEAGHLAGMQHSIHPHSIMYPSINAIERDGKWYDYDRRCRGNGVTFLALHGLA